MIRVIQLTPCKLYENLNQLDSFLEEKLTPLISDITWIQDWKEIAERFQLFKFAKMSKEEILAYQWDTERVQDIVLETFEIVKQHLEYNPVTVTVFPALPFPWLPKEDPSIWTNGFTNGPNNVQIAVPPQANEEYLKYMIAHELHHATVFRK